MGNFMNLNEVELYHQLNRLQASYVAAIDEDQLESWPDFFVEECLYKIIPRENQDRNMPLAAIYCDSRGMLVDRVVALREANIFAKHYYRHIISNMNIIELEQDFVDLRTNYAVFQTRTNGATIIYNTGCYHDKVVLTDQGLRFKEKVAVFDTFQVQTQLVTPI